MRKKIFSYITASLLIFSALAEERQDIKAVYIPLADHYPGIIAYDKYAKDMKYANYTIKQMKNWDLLRKTFESGQVDVAYIICPMAMDMFSKKDNFKWVSLLHRDGNALALNHSFIDEIKLNDKRINREPNYEIAKGFLAARKKVGKPTKCAVPHLLSTHTVVLYKFLKDYGLSLGVAKKINKSATVQAVVVAPPKSPVFLKKNSLNGKISTFEQSLPWADIAETNGYGKVGWYSKDVIKSEHGHVECIMIATDNAIKNKRKALQEVIDSIHKAGLFLEEARDNDSKMNEVCDIINSYIPLHNKKAIKQSLRKDLMVINYKKLNVDKQGLKVIMDLALEAKVLKKPININKFADDSFGKKKKSNRGIK